MKNPHPALKDPSFCIIAPTAYLESVAVKSKTHLVLAHLVDQSDEYANFYKRMRERGDFIIQDNSAYELLVPYSPDKLIELGNKCGAHAIVLPDYPFQPARVTIDAAKKFIPQFKDAGFQTFYVPQSQTNGIEEWIYSYVWGAEHPDIDIVGMSILGIPNAIPWCDPSYARVMMSKILVDRNLFEFDKIHHYLGLNAGPALEIPTLLRMGVLDTIDSSGPVWSGILGHAYTKESDSYMQTKKLKLPVDFNIKMSKDVATLRRIDQNVEMTLDLFKNNKENSVWYAKE